MHLFWDQKVKGQGYEAPKHCWHGSWCWLLLVVAVVIVSFIPSAKYSISNIVSEVNLKPLQTTLQLGLCTAVDDVERCLSFTTWTLVNRKARLFCGGMRSGLG